ncbi:MAG: hypothetical protein LBI29_02680 [Rickettsiales bacterium]|jgi:hypothetical protein|nr:hypothetical protein [Rickettsiales bacterium]
MATNGNTTDRVGRCSLRQAVEYVAFGWEPMKRVEEIRTEENERREPLRGKMEAYKKLDWYKSPENTLDKQFRKALVEVITAVNDGRLRISVKNALLKYKGDLVLGIIILKRLKNDIGQYSICVDGGIEQIHVMEEDAGKYVFHEKADFIVIEMVEPAELCNLISRNQNAAPWIRENISREINSMCIARGCVVEDVKFEELKMLFPNIESKEEFNKNTVSNPVNTKSIVGDDRKNKISTKSTIDENNSTTTEKTIRSEETKSIDKELKYERKGGINKSKEDWKVIGYYCHLADTIKNKKGALYRTLPHDESFK